MKKDLFLLAILFSVVCACSVSKKESGKDVPAPLFIDPNYHGSCDPEIVWNEHDQFWYIYYTARRPMLENSL